MRIAPFEQRNVALLAGASLLPFAGVVQSSDLAAVLSHLIWFEVSN
jgi:hypothetical protein